MTSLEMKEEFLARYDAATSLAAPGWEDSEISSFLSIAQQSIVKELYNTGRLDLISEIIKDSSEFTAAATTLVEDTTMKKTYTVDLNLITDYFLYVSSRSFIGTGTTAFIYNEMITPQMVNQFLNAGTNNPFFRVPKAIIADKKLRVIVSAIKHTGIAAVIITYVKVPDEIDIETSANCELNEALHKDVVDTAVTIAIQSVVNTKQAFQQSKRGE